MQCPFRDNLFGFPPHMGPTLTGLSHHVSLPFHSLFKLSRHVKVNSVFSAVRNNHTQPQTTLPIYIPVLIRKAGASTSMWLKIRRPGSVLMSYNNNQSWEHRGWIMDHGSMLPASRFPFFLLLPFLSSFLPFLLFVSKLELEGGRNTSTLHFAGVSAVGRHCWFLFISPSPPQPGLLVGEPGDHQ